MGHAYQYCALPFFPEFSRILIWPTAEGESSTYELWSDLTDIPSDYMFSAKTSAYVPLLNGRNYHFAAIRCEKSYPDLLHYPSKPDTSMFKTSVKHCTIKRKKKER